MSDDFSVSSYRGSYRVSFIDNIITTLPDIIHPNDLIVADEIVLQLYPQLKEELQDHTIIQFHADEATKSFENVTTLIQAMIDCNMANGARVIAIGGGVIQDLVSFTSSIYKRGIDWVFIPTTLLSQCDSCIGSKTSINFKESKNQLGSFYPPKLIMIDSNFIHTLPKIEIQAGLGEMFHYFLVSGEEDYSWAESNLHEALSNKTMLSSFVRRSLMIKRQMIEKDEFDKGPRQVFNYGHTFGHALESASNHAVPHGIAVAIGMELANRISCELGYISLDIKNRISQNLKVLWADTHCPEIPLDLYWSALKKDKKNIGTTINAILTKGIGNMFRVSLPNNDVITSLINEYIQNQEWMDVR